MPDLEDLLSQVKDYSQQKAISDLIEEGVDQNYIKQMLEIFLTNTLTKSSIDDLIDELQQYTIGTQDKLGTLDRYVKQVSSDSITQYVANYTQVLTEDAGYEFYIYLGNKQRDTRCFCNERYGKYFHKSEIEAWGNGDVMVGVDGEDCDFPWQGMIAGTNASSIFTYRGGWNCNHQIVPTITTNVPKEVVLRAIDAGYYEPSQSVIDYFGL